MKFSAERLTEECATGISKNSKSIAKQDKNKCLSNTKRIKQIKTQPGSPPILAFLF